MDGDDAQAIQQKTQALVQSSMKLGEAMYKAQQGGPEAGPGAGGPQGGPDAGAGKTGGGAAGGDGKVVDADFEEVDEKKGRTG
jgi:molecular chaperone DnaK